jgi:transcriptional antiterminator NusG
MKPVALPEEEVEIILQQLEKGPAPQVRTQFQKGEAVRIIDGPFTNFVGFIEEVDMDHGRLRVMVSIFGRQTPVELSFFQVEKA